ncbi:MAG: trypsin-like peptidase domain-containing protein [Planctomycetia bacterium]|nr:MAG: trypsin-like peptidase domain-containing protein [Planctomycetia bacterium]
MRISSTPTSVCPRHPTAPALRRVLLAGLCALLLAAPAAAQSPEPDPPIDRRRTPVVEVFERARASVVNISTSRRVQYRYRPSFASPFDDVFNFGAPRANDAVTSVGSGALIHEAGYVVTNAHVVAQATDVRVTFADNSTRPAQIVAVDSDHDLAVLRIGGGRGYPPARLARPGDILVGETVVAIGNPLGLNHTVTTGIVSAVDREVRFNQNLTYTGLIQTDASINPGNSGGPLLNLNAELIGINTAIRGDAQNIGFAIPVARLWELLPAMLDVERRARVRFGLEVEGGEPRVAAVRPDSPAARGGLREGDVLLSFNGQAIRNGIDYYVQLNEQRPGAAVTLVARREGETLSARLTIEEIPPPDGRKLAAELFGMELTELPARLRRQRDFPADLGVMISKVERNSPAERGGLEPGDILVSLGGISVPSTDDAGLVLERVRPGMRVLVDVIRVSSEPPIRGTTRVVARSR